ncbi:MAG: phosphatase PAP2 family protein [Bacteroidetes bacterium]|nr:phosphatase PAP2 family protein [Bacteroidota bacterium]
MHKLFEKLVQWDYEAWYYLNTVWHNDVLDAIVPYLRNQWTWAPLYLFLLLFMTINFGRKGWMWCVFFILTFACSDQISATLIKPIFHRLRPCNNPYLTLIIHRLVDCGSGYSFPSSHAANHFALAVFGSVTLRKTIKGIWFIALLWALSVAYAQVYVGVHFPLDVLTGALIGFIVGSITGLVYNKVYNLNKVKETPAISSS